MPDLDVERYRAELIALAEEARRTSSDLTKCSDETAELYKTTTPLGKGVYESFSDEELKGILTQAFERLGRCPSQKEIYCVYRMYIRQRFGNWPWALQAAGLKPAKEYINPRKKKPYWRSKNQKNGGNSNAKHK